MTYRLIHNDDFDIPAKMKEFTANMPEFDYLLTLANSRKADVPHICEMPVLTKEQEQHLFRQYNALKYKANKQYGKRRKLLDSHIKQIKDVLSLCNVRLAVNLLKKKNFDLELFQNKFSDAFEYLIYIIDKFDYSKGFKFSTYATLSLIRRLTKSKREKRQEQQINWVPLGELDVIASEVVIDEQEKIIESLFKAAHLNRREFKVIKENVIAENTRTYEEIGEDFDVSKERVRQIKISGLAKIKKAIEANQLLAIG